MPADLDRSVVVVTGSAVHDQRTAYRLHQECGAGLGAWLMLPEEHPDRSDGAGLPAASRGRDRLRRHLRLGPGHLARLAWSLPRRLRERRAWRERPRALARAEHRLLAQEIDEYRRRATLTPRRLTGPAGAALADSLYGLRPGVIVIPSPRVIPPDVARTWPGPILTVFPGWSPAFAGEAAVEQALFRRSLEELGATVHLLTGERALGPILRRSHPCLVPWDTPESCHHRVLALGTELLCEVAREFLDRGELVVHDPPVGSLAHRRPHLDGRLLVALRADRRHGWLPAALRDARRF